MFRQPFLVLLALAPWSVLGFPSEQAQLGRKAADLSFRKREGGNSWTWNLEDYPNPRTNLLLCNQPKHSTLCDPDNKLTHDEAEQLHQLMSRMQSNSLCLCEDDCAETDSKGIIIGIAIMGNIYHPLDANIEEYVHKFSVSLMEKWRLGTCGNAVFLLLSMDNKISHIEVGSAVQKLVPEETITEIFAQCKDHLNDGHVYQGLQSIINSIYSQVQVAHTKAMEEEDTNRGSIGLTVGLVVGFAALAGLFAAGLVVVRRRRQNAAQDKFMYEGTGSRPSSRSGSGKKDSTGPIVKVPVVFPDAVYQPCSVEESVKNPEEDEDSENQYLRTLEENPAYDRGDATAQQNARELNVVAEENSEPHTNEQVPVVGVHGQNNTNSPGSRDKLNVNA